jgi:hypothetical protein
MRRTVRNAVTLVSASMLVLFAVSCDDDDITGAGDPTYTAVMNAANEVGTGSNVTATGTVVFIDRGTSFDWTMTLNGLTAVTQSHIHAPAAAGASAGVIINLFMPNGPTGTLNGEVASGTVTDANNPNFTVAAVRALFDAGTAYANVHNSAFQGGAIRGQIIRSN